MELVGAVVVATFVIERVDECVVKRWFANEYRKAAAFWFGLSFCMLFYLSLVTTSWVLRFLIFLFFAIVVVTLVYVIIEDWVRKRWPNSPSRSRPVDGEADRNCQRSVGGSATARTFERVGSR
jgi:hypothetical protein